MIWYTSAAMLNCLDPSQSMYSGLSGFWWTSTVGLLRTSQSTLKALTSSSVCGTFAFVVNYFRLGDLVTSASLKSWVFPFSNGSVILA